MSEKVKVPVVGESIVEVTIANWLKKDNDRIEPDEVIAELESDKATFELTAPKAGVLKILSQTGETVPVGKVICEIVPSDQPAATPELKQTPPPSSVDLGSESIGESIEMKVPELGESINEVTISNWLKKEGDSVALDEVIAEVESDKATFELPAKASGILRIVAQKGDTLLVDGLICKIERTKKDTPAGEKQSLPSSPSDLKSRDSSYAAGHPSPAARKILDEKGVSSAHVLGSGVGGRITKADAMKSQSTPEKSPLVASHTVEHSRAIRKEKINSLRRTIARRLVSVKNETAMLTTFNEVNMKPIMDLRSRYKEKFKEKYEVGLGFMSFFTSAVCAALKEFPSINAYIDGDEIEYHDYCDISIAVSTPRGLVVPVIRNAELLNMHEIEREIVRLAARGREGKLSIEEMTGGTFSITNGGVFGSMLSTPILNPPQSAILGMHNIVQRPVAMGQEVVVRPVMYLAVSYDHRIVDGQESVSFLFRIKEILEDPSRLILGI